jgi:hypothetical protein
MPGLRYFPRQLALISAICALSPFARAQAPDVAAQTELIQLLLKRIDRLENRVTELESERSGSLAEKKPSAAADPSATAAPLAPATITGMGTAGHDHGTPLEPTSTYPSLRLSGFGDINYVASDQPGTHTGFNEGQFILHMSSALSSRVTYFGELSMTARTDAGSGSPAAGGFNLEVERSMIRFDQSDHLKVSFGRYHTPISYWNTAFHHGSWLQTTASRPEMIQFGGSFIPVHFVGTLAEGSFSAKGLNLNYNAGIGNGRSSVLSRSGDWGDVNNNKAWLANVFVKPDKLYGLQVGAAVYRDKINATGRPEAREWIQSAHLVWSKENPEFIAEFFNVNHRRPGSNVAVNSQAWYAQMAWRLPFAAQWKPYYRYDYIHVPMADLVFRGALSNLAGSTLGVRYDISNFSAFKLEYRRQSRPGLADINVAWVQTSFTF